jgi:murein DD-endopeptidase MepM/ murein hydrolase activator NlpD
LPRLSSVTPVLGLLLLLATSLPIAHAETLVLPPTAPVEARRAHRPISDDPLLDRRLTAIVPFIPDWPTNGTITTYFGELGPLSPRGHTGLDIAGPEGSPIEAVESGEVVKATFTDDGYGGLVIVAHPSGYETWYGHLSKILVARGQHVTRGWSVGLRGSTGLSTGPHLHFEVRENGQILNPLAFLKETALQPPTNA